MSDHDTNEVREDRSEPDDKPTVLSVIRGLQDGAVSAKSLSITSDRFSFQGRRRFVEPTNTHLSSNVRKAFSTSLIGWPLAPRG